MDAVGVDFDADAGPHGGVVRGLNQPLEAPEVHNDVILHPLKAKLSRFAIPYVIWMALFVVAPIVLVVVYAFSNDLGGFTLENFSKMGTYAVVSLFSRIDIQE